MESKFNNFSLVMEMKVWFVNKNTWLVIVVQCNKLRTSLVMFNMWPSKNISQVQV
jgi:hypothetical protein